MRHLARTMSFDDLLAGLQHAEAAGLVSERGGPDGLRLYCYTQQCVHSRQWGDFTKLARGLILDVNERRVVATPFPKFFNLGENGAGFPAQSCEPFEVFEKLDGSLIILFNHKGKWLTATKGSFGSDQAEWAANQISSQLLDTLDPASTYLLEAIYPENRIVVAYPYTGLVLLGAYDGVGNEYPYETLQAVGGVTGWRMVRRRYFANADALRKVVERLPATEEGFVVRFSDGTRLKMKGEEYCRVHRLMSRVTPLGVWEAMRSRDDLVTFRKELPEEFWKDFDTILGLLKHNLSVLLNNVQAAATEVAQLSDKDVGLALSTFSDEVRRFIFPYRKSGGDLLGSNTRDAVVRAIRPDGNVLAGYMPSSTVNRFTTEAG